MIEQSLKALNDGRYLEAVDALRASLSRSPGLEGRAFSLWWQVHPFLSGTPNMSLAGRGELQPLDEAVTTRLRAAKGTDAVEEITRRARDTRIVIVNESHHVPRDRAFGLAVARALAPLGYNILAVETFANDTDDAKAAAQMRAMAAAGHPRLKDGMYLKDPVFGDFVRQALAMGYTPVSYEQTGKDRSITAREQAQAENLVKRIFSRDADARVLIYVGYSHAAEAALGPNEWMAARLKRMTGIDPLTIDQTTLNEFTPSARQRIYYGIVAPLASSAPVVLMDDTRSPLVLGQYEGKIDLQVVHPRLSWREGRPDWLWRMGREPRSVPPQLLPRQGRRLVQAFIEGESADAIPIDQLVVEAGKRVPPLALPPGKPIRLEVQNPPSQADQRRFQRGRRGCDAVGTPIDPTATHQLFIAKTPHYEAD